jgi:hypothetical protein
MYHFSLAIVNTPSFGACQYHPHGVLFLTVKLSHTANIPDTHTVQQGRT